MEEKEKLISEKKKKWSITLKGKNPAINKFSVGLLLVVMITITLIIYSSGENENTQQTSTPDDLMESNNENAEEDEFHDVPPKTPQPSSSPTPLKAPPHVTEKHDSTKDVRDEEFAKFVEDKIANGWNATENLIAMAAFCETAPTWSPSSPTLLYDRANCGRDYLDAIESLRNQYINQNRSVAETKKIFLLGKSYYRPVFSKLIYLSGCALGGVGKCPYDAGCSFTLTSRASAVTEDAHMIVINNLDIEEIKNFKYHGKLLKTLYSREAVWPYVSKYFQNAFDLTMGVHFNRSGVLNPLFILHPIEMILGDLSDFAFVRSTLMKSKSNFGLSLISDCETKSQREVYLNYLTDLLGEDRVHRYGGCGHMYLKRDDPKEEYRVVAKYKFYFAFENSLQNGYITEKLYSMLSFPIVPVYYGALDVPKITKTKSFIRASDFPNPKELAKYLLYLDQNEHEYLKYHEWRSAETPADKFDEDFLRYVSMHVPSATEMLRTHLASSVTANLGELNKFSVHDFIRLSRTAACCRLCNDFAVKQAKEMKRKGAFVRGRGASRGGGANANKEPVWPVARIRNFYFEGEFKRPGHSSQITGRVEANETHFRW